VLNCDVKFELLADHLDAIPTLARLFREQWPDYFSSWTRARMEEDFLSEASRDRLPIRIVAMDSSGLVGTVVLRERRFSLDQEIVTELGGLYVVSDRRRAGIGTELVQVGMNLARQLGCEVLYATTTTAEGILKGLGWDFVNNIVHGTEELALYCRRIL
jgi:N-acetylglutamate synthase-like GNAT family acetyltransferase